MDLLPFNSFVETVEFNFYFYFFYGNTLHSLKKCLGRFVYLKILSSISHYYDFTFKYDPFTLLLSTISIIIIIGAYFHV